jgi:hypothetical protein
MISRIYYSSLLKAIAWAVDTKSHYADQHIKRLVDMYMTISELVNNTEEGIYKTFKFSEEELMELKYAAWMHDIGKVVTP